MQFPHAERHVFSTELEFVVRFQSCKTQHGCSQRPLVKGRSKSVQLSLNLKGQPSRQSLQKTGTGLCASRESAEAAKVPDSGVNGAVSLWVSWLRTPPSRGPWCGQRAEGGGRHQSMRQQQVAPALIGFEKKSTLHIDLRYGPQ